jgi:hypothetical protein
MRAIPDINGQRRCRKCEKLLPLSEFSQIPRRHVCKLCRARMYKKKSTEKRTVAQTMMANVQWDSKHIFRVPHNLRVHQIPTLPCVAEVGTIPVSVSFFCLFYLLRYRFVAGRAVQRRVLYRSTTVRVSPRTTASLSTELWQSVCMRASSRTKSTCIRCVVFFAPVCFFWLSDVTFLWSLGYPCHQVPGCKEAHRDRCSGIVCSMSPMYHASVSSRKHASRCSSAPLQLSSSRDNTTHVSW